MMIAVVGLTNNSINLINCDEVVKTNPAKNKAKKTNGVPKNKLTILKNIKNIPNPKLAPEKLMILPVVSIVSIP